MLVENLTKLMETGKVGNAVYDGYTSCPLFTGYGSVSRVPFVDIEAMIGEAKLGTTLTVGLWSKGTQETTSQLDRYRAGSPPALSRSFAVD